MTPITQEHQTHIDQIGLAFWLEMSNKYKRGVQEHGGHIKDMSSQALIENSIAEAIDQVVYLMTLREKMRGQEREGLRGAA